MTRRGSIYTVAYRHERRRRIFGWVLEVVRAAMAAMLILAGFMVVGMTART